MENLDLISWILNQDFNNQNNGDGDGDGKTYTDSEIQGAIWALTDGAQLEQNYGEIDLTAFSYADGVQVLPGTGTLANATEIIELAQANGEGFEAGSDDVVGMVIAPKNGDQPFIVGVSLSNNDVLG